MKEIGKRRLIDMIVVYLKNFLDQRRTKQERKAIVT
jgi:hypothetical protein